MLLPTMKTTLCVLLLMVVASEVRETLLLKKIIKDLQLKRLKSLKGTNNVLFAVRPTETLASARLAQFSPKSVDET